MAATVGRISVGLIGKEGSEKPVVNVSVNADGWAGDIALYLTAGAMPYTVEKLKACGLTDGHSLIWLEDNPDGLAGNAVQVKVFEEEYNGNWNEKADIVTWKREVKPLEKSKLAAFDDLFKGAQTGLPF